jgi:hypothetical protein
MLVCVGIPSIDGKPCANTVDSLLAEQLLGYGQGVHFLVMWEIGCSLIGVARNKLAQRFLDQPKADCMVFVDSDISWKGGDLARLAKRPEDVIGGTYRAKRDEERYHIRGIPEPVGDVLKVEGVPTGFLKVSRHALETISAETYTDNDTGKVVKDLFPVCVRDGEYWGEDYNFCRMWRETGGSVFLDPSIQLRHHDGLKAYTGDVREWLKGLDA